MLLLEKPLNTKRRILHKIEQIWICPTNRLQANMLSLTPYCILRLAQAIDAFANGHQAQAKGHPRLNVLTCDLLVGPKMRWFFIYCFSLGTLIKTVKCFVTRLTTELLETSSLRIIDVQLLGERREHTIVLFCFRFLSPIMTFFNRYFPSGMVNPL